MSYPKPAVAAAAVTLLSDDPTLTLSDVSRALGLERHTLERAFREHFGKTFRSVRLQIRFRHACVALTRQPPISIKEVAGELGYATPQAFSRFVVKMSGQCPAQLRVELLHRSGLDHVWLRESPQ